MVNLIVEILATLLDVVFMVWFVSKFHGTSILKKPISFVWPIVFFIMQITFDHFFHVFAVIPILCVWIISICFSWTLEPHRHMWAILAAILYAIVIMLSSSLVYATFSLLIDHIDVAIYGTNSYLRAIYIATCKLVHLAFYRLLLYLFRKDRTLNLKNGIFSFSFTVITAVALGILMDFALKNQNSQYDYMIFVLALILLSLNLVLYIMINEIQALLKKQYHLMLMHERMNFEKSRMDEAATIWGNIRKFKHDLYNHFAVIEGQLNNNNIEGCKQYLSKLHETVDSMGCLIKSGNSVIDYLTNSKLSNLEGVEILVGGFVGNFGDICDVDLSCILGNILDNAIEAQEKVIKGKRIELHFGYQSPNRIIICKNAICESVLQSNHKLNSAKEFPGEHGLGHQIVEATVQKYGGIIDYFESDDMFGVQIVIPETKQL